MPRPPNPYIDLICSIKQGAPHLTGIEIQTILKEKEKIFYSESQIHKILRDNKDKWQTSPKIIEISNNNNINNNNNNNNISEERPHRFSYPITSKCSKYKAWTKQDFDKAISKLLRMNHKRLASFLMDIRNILYP